MPRPLVIELGPEDIKLVQLIRDIERCTLEHPVSSVTLCNSGYEYSRARELIHRCRFLAERGLLQRSPSPNGYNTTARGRMWVVVGLPAWRPP